MYLGVSGRSQLKINKALTVGKKGKETLHERKTLLARFELYVLYEITDTTVFVCCLFNIIAYIIKCVPEHYLKFDFLAKIHAYLVLIQG